MDTKLDIGIKQINKFMIIIKSFKLLFVGLLFLELVMHLCININISKFFIDPKSLIIILLIISLLIEKTFFSIILLLYSFSIIILNFSPLLISGKTVEKIYYEIFLGTELSSYVRNNVTNKFWLLSIITNLSFYLSGYIIFLEIPYRQYKNNRFPFNK
ncbi:hypothetical protein [Chryseobacterium sp. NKUCC03_KSP]|uniref:hypothetical protein n=1 Tax=Chryseobacterium sp. NKUCC03_KSP TaxID=2842125 RepID=UPI001C5A76E1|nr:hypothetical protein [Chryseobacterium sp. NKUCC03_KSP]MBW3523072.1 hypothetical protein [Chryseobacterium sp. NKUCC03_KSP]